MNAEQNQKMFPICFPSPEILINTLYGLALGNLECGLKFCVASSFLRYCLSAGYHFEREAAKIETIVVVKVKNVVSCKVFLGIGLTVESTTEVFSYNWLLYPVIANSSWREVYRQG